MDERGQRRVKVEERESVLGKVEDKKERLMWTYNG